MTFKKIILIISVFFLPIFVFAFGGETNSAPLLSDNFQNIVEIASLLLALLASFYAVKLAALARGGQMERTWNILALASIIFALNQATNNILKSLGIEAYGYDKFFELLLALVLVAAFMSTRKMLLRQVSGK